MPSGYLFNGKTTVLVRHEQPEGLEGYLSAKPGEVYARWLVSSILIGSTFFLLR